MSYYGISAIKLDQAGTEVEEALVHKITRNDPADTEIGFDVGTAIAYDEVASLINTSGDTVFVLAVDALGSYQPTDTVRVKSGQREYLESFGADGAATAALLELPKYQ